MPALPFYDVPPESWLGDTTWPPPPHMLRPCPAGTLALALRADWQPYLAALLEPMFQTGLTGGHGVGELRVCACE